jgi:hypothetical protein
MPGRFSSDSEVETSKIHVRNFGHGRRGHESPGIGANFSAHRVTLGAWMVPEPLGTIHSRPPSLFVAGLRYARTKEPELLRRLRSEK